MSEQPENTEVLEVLTEGQDAPVQEGQDAPILDGQDEAKRRRATWASFIEGDAANFFADCKLEKMAIEDGNGNKAKMSRTKDGGIKVEYTSTVTL